MVTAPAGSVASATPVPKIPASGASTENNGQAPHSQFHDVYESVPTNENISAESTSKQQNTDPKEPGPKRQIRDNGTDRPAVVPVMGLGHPLPRSPLILALPVLGQEVQQSGEQDGSTNGTDSETASATDTVARSLLPHVAVAGTAPAMPALLPSASSMAFSIRLKPEAPPTPAVHLAPQPPVRTQPTGGTPRELAHPFSQPPTAPAQEPERITPVKSANEGELSVVRDFATTTSVLESHPLATSSEGPETLHIAATSAVHEVQAILPEAPKTTPNAEILLHLPGKDQSIAAVRLFDRSGTVNVSVHTPDPELRNSLRSNLGELASQLNGQGFKTEVVKPTVIAAHADNAQDSRHDGQRSANQQHHSTPGDRQPQRDRRTNPGRWREELEEETSRNAYQGGAN